MVYVRSFGRVAHSVRVKVEPPIGKAAGPGPRRRILQAGQSQHVILAPIRVDIGDGPARSQSVDIKGPLELVPGRAVLASVVLPVEEHRVPAVREGSWSEVKTVLLVIAPEASAIRVRRSRPVRSNRELGY